MPIPLGTTRSDLDRLSAILDRTAATRLVILGDFLHSRAGRDHTTLDSIGAWRAERSSLEVLLVRGNHDRSAGDPPAEWGFHCVTGPLQDGPFTLRHEPPDEERPGAGGPPRGDHERFTLAGHIHPCVRLHGAGRQAMRCACFHIAPSLALLPAFGAFTGTHPIRPRQGDRVFAVGEGAVIEVKPARE